MPRDKWRTMYDSIPNAHSTDRQRAEYGFQDYVITCVARTSRIVCHAFEMGGGSIPVIQMYECSSCGEFRAQGVCRCYCLKCPTL